MGRPCACNCKRAKAVTIKRFDVSDGATLWEYGPGIWWEHVHGGTTILGLSADPSSFSLDAYAVVAGIGVTASFPTRPAVANCSEALKLVALNESDGTEASSVTLAGHMLTSVSEYGIGFLLGAPLDVCALSTGYYLMAMNHPPVMELDDFNLTPAASKSYTLHGHSMVGGDLHLTTVTSGDTITFAHNASTATIKTAIESSSDVVSATVTGGPYPFTKISITVVWNSAADDFATFKIDSTYTPSIDPVSTRAAATAYDPSTGKIVHSVGRVFGAGDSVLISYLIAQTGSPPTTTTPASGQISKIIAGASGRVAIISSDAHAEGWTTGTTWSRNWIKKINTIGTLASGAHLTGDSTAAAYSFTKGDYPNPVKTRNGALVDFSSGSVTEIDDSLPYDKPGGGSFALHHNSASDRLIYRCFDEDTPQPFDYPNLKYTYVPLGEEIEILAGGGDRTRLQLGHNHACDGTNLVVPFIAATNIAYATKPPLKSPPTIAGTSAKAYNWEIFLAPQTAVFETGTQWRMRFGNSAAYTTAWLDWHASIAQIEAALLAIFPENTEGVTSNVTVYPFGVPTALFGTGPFSYLEYGLEILFAGANTLSYVPTSLVDRPGDLTVQFQNHVSRYTETISFIDLSDMSEVWGRSFGTQFGGSGDVVPDKVWFANSKLFAYGARVENDLP